MKKYLYLLFPIISFILFLVFTILVKTVDVTYIHDIGYLGFYNVNSSINSKIQAMNTSLYDKLSDVIMIISFVGVAIFAVIGIVQLIKRKSFKQVDPILYILLGLYVLVAAMYLTFSLMKINFSPLSTKENLKDSYPSSHVFISITLFVSGVMTATKYVNMGKWMNVIGYAGAILLSILSAVTRMFSGQHYFTDIIGAILLAIFLISAYYSALKAYSSRGLRK